MSNRAERRAQARQEQRETAELIASSYFRNKVKLEEQRKKKLEEIERNGITMDHLRQNYEKGFKEGYDKASEPVVKGCYAAVCLAMNELHGFGRRRCLKLLNALDHHITMSLTTTELIDAVWDRMKLKIDFKEPFERIQEVD